MPKILIVTGDAAEDLEVMYPYQRLLEEGMRCTLRRRLGSGCSSSCTTSLTASTRTPRSSGTPGLPMALAEVDPARYVALVLPGGRAPEYLRNDPECLRIVRHFFAEDKPVAHLCHGPLVTAAAGVLAGRRSAAYPALAPDVTAAGAQFVDGEAVVDGMLVSGRAWPDHPAWMREFVEDPPGEGAHRGLSPLAS